MDRRMEEDDPGLVRVLLEGCELAPGTLRPVGARWGVDGA